MLTRKRVTAVASGGALRALVKERGPRRLARSSYGVLRTEFWKDYPEHSDPGVRGSRDPNDGEVYIKTINWVLKRVGTHSTLLLKLRTKRI
jgi:hypothetical protein